MFSEAETPLTLLYEHMIVHGWLALTTRSKRLAVPLVSCTLPAFVLLTIAPVLAGALSSLAGSLP